MLSCRSFYSPELEFCRRSDRGVPLQLHASQHGEQYDTSDSFSNRTSPSSDSESKLGGPARKRVPVACGRCRKRKIKCSGDDGKGACSNCRNSGTVYQCQFLRVNSLSQEILSQSSPRWQLGTRYSPYSVNSQGGRHNSFAVSSPYNASGNCPAIQPSFEYSTYTGNSQATPWARNQTGAAYSYSCDEEPPLDFSSHPAYLLPNAESTTNSNDYIVSPAGSRTWASGTQINRGQQSTVYAEQPLTSAIAPVDNQFVSYSNAQATLSSQSAFPGILSSHTSMLTNDRVLPDPAASRSQSATKITTIESVPMSLLHRASNTWIESMLGSGHPSTSRTLSTDLSDGSDITARYVTSSAPQDVGFGFIPITNCPQEGSIQSISVVAAAETRQSDFEFPKTPLTEYNKDKCQFSSCESVASPDEGDAESYGYTSINKSGHPSAHYSTTSGQLSNGQGYTRLRHEPSHVSSALEEYRQHSSAYHDGLPHRASIASMNKSGC